MNKKSPMRTVDDETIERIKEIIQVVVENTELISAYWVQILAQARLVNQATVGLNATTESEVLGGLIQGSGQLVTWLDTYHKSTVEPLKVCLASFQEAFESDFDLKAKIEAMTIH